MGPAIILVVLFVVILTGLIVVFVRLHAKEQANRRPPEGG